MGEHTIKGTFGIDTKPAKESVDDLKRHVEQRSREIKGLISGGAGAGGAAPGGNGAGPTRPASGGGGSAISSAAGAAIGFIGGITALVGSEIIAKIGQVASRFQEARKEAEELETRIHGVSLAANKSGGFQGIEEIRSDLGKAVQEADDLHKQLAEYKVPGNVAGKLKLAAEAALHGQTPGGYQSGLEEKERAARKAASEDVTKIADKMAETNQIEHERFSVSEQQAAITQEEVRHKEALNMLAAEASRTGRQNLDATNRENQLSQERIRDLTVVRNAAQADLNLQEQRSQVANRNLSPQREAIELAHQELQAARENLAIEEKIGGVRAQNARIRVNKAESAATAADLAGAGPMQPGEMAQRRADINKAGARLELLRSKQKIEGFDPARQDEIERLNRLGADRRIEDIQKTMDNTTMFGPAGADLRRRQLKEIEGLQQPTADSARQPSADEIGAGIDQQNMLGGNASSLRHQMSKVRWPWSDRDNRDRPMMGDEPMITPSPLPPPSATPSGLPSPSGTPQAHAGSDVADKIAAVMDRYWGRA
jgi:hypothetical protein